MKRGLLLLLPPPPLASSSSVSSSSTLSFDRNGLPVIRLMACPHCWARNGGDSLLPTLINFACFHDLSERKVERTESGGEEEEKQNVAVACFPFKIMSLMMVLMARRSPLWAAALFSLWWGNTSENEKFDWWGRMNGWQIQLLKGLYRCCCMF